MFKRIRGLLAATLAMATLALASSPASATGIGLALTDPLNAAEKTFVEHTVAIGASFWTAIGDPFDNGNTSCCGPVRATWLADKWSGVSVFESLYAATGLSGTYPNLSALPDPSYHYGSVGIYAAPGSPLSNFLNAVAADFVVPAAQSAFADLHYGNASVYVVLDDISLVPALKAQMVIDGAGMPPLAPPVPEPETYAMFLAGLGFLGYTARRRKQAFTRPSFGQLRAA